MKFRKRPVVIEAYQAENELFIPTLEGVMHAEAGDWIITGVQGEQYPCKPDIFLQTYEPADQVRNVWVVWSSSGAGLDLVGVFQSADSARDAIGAAASVGADGVRPDVPTSGQEEIVVAGRSFTVQVTIVEG